MIYILGAGGVARDTLNVYRDSHRLEQIAGFIEQNSNRQGTKVHGINVYDSSAIETLSNDSMLIGAIGSPLRKKWIDEIKSKGFDFDNAIHPSVIKYDFPTIGKGNIIYAGVILAADVSIGNHSIVNINTIIGHDTSVGDYVTINPGVSIAGNTCIGDGSWIGIGATIIEKVSVGRNSYIGAGAVVTKDIPDNVLALGVPAKSVRTMDESDWHKIM